MHTEAYKCCGPECHGGVRLRIIKAPLHDRRSNDGGHGVSECRSDESERPGMAERLCVLSEGQVVVPGDANNFNSFEDRKS